MSSLTIEPVRFWPGQNRTVPVGPHLAAPETNEHWPTAPGWLPLTLDSVDRIVNIDDPAVRNLWITQSYADLGRRLLDRYRTDQSWCTFAIWASNTAGVSIRGEELTAAVGSLIGQNHVDQIVRDANDHAGILRFLGITKLLEHTGVERLITGALTDVSNDIAHGNTLVYVELAPIFVRFTEWLEGDGARRDTDLSPNLDDTLDETLDELGVPSDEQDHLVRLAFRNYALAAVADDTDDRAQHVLAANVAAVLHEQQRLQHDIASAMNAGLFDVGIEVANLCHRWLPHRLARRLIAMTHRRIAEHLEKLWDHLATELLMTLSTPGQTLHLGTDVPPIEVGNELFPIALQQLDQPELVALMDEWDRTDGTGCGSGAQDWTDLHQRMGYIVNLFRSRQQHLALTAPPFTAAQVDTMASEELPADL